MNSALLKFVYFVIIIMLCIDVFFFSYSRFHDFFALQSSGFAGNDNFYAIICVVIYFVAVSFFARYVSMTFENSKKKSE